MTPMETQTRPPGTEIPRNASSPARLNVLSDLRALRATGEASGSSSTAGGSRNNSVGNLSALDRSCSAVPRRSTPLRNPEETVLGMRSAAYGQPTMLETGLGRLMQLRVKTSQSLGSAQWASCFGASSTLLPTPTFNGKPLERQPVRAPSDR